MVGAKDDVVFKALANPLRRRILDELRSGPRTTGEISSIFPRLSRFAVMQHLDVLQESGLLLVRKEGRKRFNYLNAVPLERVHRRWVGRFAAEAAKKSLALEGYLEGERRMNVRTVKIENEIKLAAPITRVWEALTREQLEWYPHTYGQSRVKGLVWEDRVGGNAYEDWGDGRGAMYGTLTYYDPPTSYCLRGHLKDGVSLENWIALREEGDHTILSSTMVAFGEITDEQEQGIRFHGSLENYSDQLKAYVESERGLGRESDT